MMKYGARPAKQRKIIALDGQGKKQQRPESPTVTPLGMPVNTSIPKPSDMRSHQRMPPVPCISSTLGDTGVYRHTTEPIFIQDQT